MYNYPPYSLSEEMKEESKVETRRPICLQNNHKKLMSTQVGNSVLQHIKIVMYAICLVFIHVSKEEPLSTIMLWASTCYDK